MPPLEKMHPRNVLHVAGTLSALNAIPVRFSLDAYPRLRALARGVRQAALSGDNGDGFPAYVAKAQAAGMDVNDWIERSLGWLPALPVLEQLVFPFLRPDSVVCEVGVGTGRWSRHILERIPDGRMVLVDKSPWIVNFLRTYFGASTKVEAVQCNGNEIPVSPGGWADMAFSQGMFITLKLGHVFVYLQEFARALKPGGVAVFDFIDPETPEGWSFLEREKDRSFDVFAYHSLASVSHACERAGFEVLGSQLVGKSTYVVARKN